MRPAPSRRLCRLRQLAWQALASLGKAVFPELQQTAGSDGSALACRPPGTQPRAGSAADHAADAAIHGQNLARDVLAGRRGEQQRRALEVVGVAEPVQR